VNRDKYAYVVLWVKKVLVKNSFVCKIPQWKSQKQENLRKPVSMFRCTFELTALLSKKIHPRLHCYTLRCYMGALFFNREVKLRIAFPRPKFYCNKQTNKKIRFNWYWQIERGLDCNSKMANDSAESPT